MNYPTQSKQIFLQGIDDNKNIPDECKVELKRIVSDQFMILGNIVGLFELTILREKQVLNGGK